MSYKALKNEKLDNHTELMYQKGDKVVLKDGADIVEIKHIEELSIDNVCYFAGKKKWFDDDDINHATTSKLRYQIRNFNPVKKNGYMRVVVGGNNNEHGLTKQDVIEMVRVAYNVMMNGNSSNLTINKKPWLVFDSNAVFDNTYNQYTDKSKLKYSGRYGETVKPEIVLFLSIENGCIVNASLKSDFSKNYCKENKDNILEYMLENLECQNFKEG